MSNANSDVFKVVICGGPRTGKTQIYNSLQKIAFVPKYESSDAATDIEIKMNITGVDQPITLWLYDLPGKEALMGLNRMFVRDAQCALIVYDVNEPESLTNAQEWLTELENSAPSSLVLGLCGNKMDTQLPHKLTQEQG